MFKYVCLKLFFVTIWHCHPEMNVFQDLFIKKTEASLSFQKSMYVSARIFSFVPNVIVHALYKHLGFFFSFHLFHFYGKKKKRTQHFVQGFLLWAGIFLEWTWIFSIKVHVIKYVQNKTWVNVFLPRKKRMNLWLCNLEGRNWVRAA